LERLGENKPWTLRLRAKLAALQGDQGSAESRLRQAVERWGDRLGVLGELAAILYCQGREAEARGCLARSVGLVTPDLLKARQEENRIWADQLNRAMAEGRADGGQKFNLGASINYSDSDEIATKWRQHFHECREADGFRTVAAYTNTVMFERVEDLFGEDPDLKKVVNYGTLCGVREHAMAGRHPERVFAGYDISEVATALNRDRFRGANLMFESDLEVLLQRLGAMAGACLLVHCRTADIMLPEAVKRVYRSCHAHGVRWILSAEYVGQQIGTMNYPNFRAQPVDTVHWEGILMIHNYDKIFPEVGYRVVDSRHRPVPLLVSGSGEGLQPAQVIRLVLAERQAS